MPDREVLYTVLLQAHVVNTLFNMCRENIINSQNDLSAVNVPTSLALFFKTPLANKRASDIIHNLIESARVEIYKWKSSNHGTMFYVVQVIIFRGFSSCYG